mgnify:CR=1 FL=1
MGGKLRLPRRGEAGYEEAKRALTKRGKKLWKKIQNHDQVLAAQARMRAEQAQRMAAQEQQMNRLAQAKK